MDATVMKALTMMLIALPTMFFVIAVFIAATKLLHKTFPGSQEDE
ncbi:hypothetical protein [Pectinatus haikarae]|uniref:Uncharacterized protein n=1 Tax=Pectinatus haikarae TaxID=349096 RepID=A0ABT9Y719_9FIRM|nr:hypothetical protein [Pectinatus haikarae]MDQ0203628.1 hypothetical protein [Pectinatus haikarae]